jgi:purine-nucleoside phosphorylase
MAGLVGIHPLRGPNIDEFGVRFPPLSDAYDLDLRRRTHRAWVKLGLDKQQRRLHEGVYAFVAGPTYVPKLFDSSTHPLGLICFPRFH